MPSKRRREQLKKARAAAVQSIKKRKLESSLLPDSMQLKTDDDKLNKSDTIDTGAKSGTLFGNGGDSASEDGRHFNAEEPHFPGGQSRNEGGANPESRRKEIKWNREGETKLRGIYGRGSRSTRKRQQKLARELELGASKTNKLGALWRGHIDQVTISAPNDSEKLHMPSHLRSDAEQDINPASKRTVSKNVPLTEDELSNALDKAKEVGGFSEARTAYQHSMVGAVPGIIAGESCGTSNHDGNELQRRCDDLASLP